jgi:hypothetical protein
MRALRTSIIASEVILNLALAARLKRLKAIAKAIFRRGYRPSMGKNEEAA